MTDRGEYRSIRRVLLDGPDFQKLSSDARWVFVAMKLSIGPTGIDVQYVDALAVQLAQQTGLESPTVLRAIAELRDAGWLAVQGNVVWVVGHLEHDPHMKAKDEKHRKSVQRHVASLPRLAIVAEFVKAQPDWFPPDEVKTTGLQWALEGPSKGHRSTENERENKTRTTSAPQKPARAVWMLPASRVWEGKFGAGSFPWGKFGKHAKPLKDHHPPPLIADRLQRYLNRTESRFVSIPRFVEMFADFAPADAGKLVDEFGCLTPFGEIETTKGLRLA